MGLLHWFIEQWRQYKVRYALEMSDRWESIGHETPFYGGGDTGNVPKWVLHAYKKCHIHHTGIAYYFKGGHYQYKIVESGQGGGDHIFYRRLRKR